MVVFPNAKINLGLRVIRRREDGYHDLDTVFFPFPVNDILEVVGRDRYVHHERIVEFSMSGNEIEGSPEQNLCVKAYHLLKKDFPDLPPIAMHLHKVIPSGAGLGGGSSDGSFTLSLLNARFALGLSEEKLIEYALQLGSDCPFFILNQPCSASGRGELLTPVAVSLNNYELVLVCPGIHISTAQAFAGIVPGLPEKSCTEIIHQPPETWKAELNNDFEKTVFKNYPAIRSIKDELYHAGAIYASMTGTGSSVYGIFPAGTKSIRDRFPSEYAVFERKTQP